MSAAVKIPAHLYATLRHHAGLPPPYIETLHPKQLAFVRDKSKLKTALTGRRGGKTHGVGSWLMEELACHDDASWLPWGRQQWRS